ncbi:MAG: hypothetical protein ACLP9K_05695 [Nitrososphaerales archaeon]|jgi:hypothetical protein
MPAYNHRGNSNVDDEEVKSEAGEEEVKRGGMRKVQILGRELDEIRRDHSSETTEQRLDVEIRDLPSLIPQCRFFQKEFEDKTCEQEKSGLAVAGVSVGDPHLIEIGEPL